MGRGAYSTFWRCTQLRSFRRALVQRAITLPLMSQADPQLYAVYLGGDPAPGRIGEDHEVVFVVADDVTSARRLARGKWRGDDPKPHVDMVQELDVIDGYAVSLSPTDRSSSAAPDATYEPSPDGVSESADS
jgi:Domain of Unknown Function (DUF1543)